MLANEEKNAALDGSAFARVLGRIMEARGITADEEHTLELAEWSGLATVPYGSAKINLDGSTD